MHSETRPVGPVSSLTERIQFIDVLRGMALFGILTANMRAFFGPMETYGDIQVLFHSRADVIAQFFVDFLFQGKFISIFSFLFGMGFAIQMSRAEARGRKIPGLLSAPPSRPRCIRHHPRNPHLGRRHSPHLRAHRRHPPALPQ